MRGVYFIHAPAAGLVKIGSAVNIYQRFRNLELASPVALTFLGWSAGDATTERRLHRQFASLRAHGEWFTWSQDIIAAPRLAWRGCNRADGQSGRGGAAEAGEGNAMNRTEVTP